MGFKTNMAAATQSDSIKPVGDYECLIARAEEHTYNKNGKDKTCLNIRFLIRNDVEQNYKNSYIFHTLWKRNEPTENDKQVKGYGFNQVMALGKAAGLPDGKDYDSLEQFLEELIKKPVLVTIKHGKWNGEKREEVSRLNPTKFPEVKHTFKQSQSSTTQTYAQPQQSYVPAQPANQGFVDMPIDDDLPF